MNSFSFAIVTKLAKPWQDWEFRTLAQRRLVAPNQVYNSDHDNVVLLTLQNPPTCGGPYFTAPALISKLASAKSTVRRVRETGFKISSLTSDLGQFPSLLGALTHGSVKCIKHSCREDCSWTASPCMWLNLNLIFSHLLCDVFVTKTTLWC